MITWSFYREKEVRSTGVVIGIVSFTKWHDSVGWYFSTRCAGCRSSRKLHASPQEAVPRSFRGQVTFHGVGEPVLLPIECMNDNERIARYAAATGASQP